MPARPSPAGAASVLYAERLLVPLSWWLLGSAFLITLWIAFVVSMPAWLAWTATAVCVLLTYAMFWLIGAARIQVRDATLFAGRAHIDVGLLGEPQPLDAAGTRRAAGVEADARAFLVLRPYLKRSVKVPVLDPRDPAPYWLLSTRRPTAFADALERAKADHGSPMDG